jgi:hypothetical protein
MKLTFHTSRTPSSSIPETTSSALISMANSVAFSSVIFDFSTQA